MLNNLVDGLKQGIVWWIMGILGGIGVPSFLSLVRCVVVGMAVGLKENWDTMITLISDFIDQT